LHELGCRVFVVGFHVHTLAGETEHLSEIDRTFALLLVAELKRGATADTTDLQALKYAAYCANLTVDDVIEMHARYTKVDDAAARSAVLEHAPSLEDTELGPVRVCLLAADFGPSVSSVVLWLNEIGLDMSCVQLVARKVDDGHAVLSVRQVLPPPQAKDYLVRRRRRSEVEEQREAKQRNAKPSRY
jgi:hypothetical protein